MSDKPTDQFRDHDRYKIIVLISATIEWDVVCGLLHDRPRHPSPFGQYFPLDIDIDYRRECVIFFHGGWGRTSAAASTQYVIDRWSPELIINLGTCGGFEGRIDKGAIILVERTVIYDIIEQMADPDEHIDHYSTTLDLSWLEEPYPQEVMRTLIVSGDRDLLPEDLGWLTTRFGAVAGDWESGAIAWVAKRNGMRCLILRGVTDLVGSRGGEAYEGNIHLYRQNTERVMRDLITMLPEWIGSYYRKTKNDDLDKR